MTFLPILTFPKNTFQSLSFPGFINDNRIVFERIKMTTFPYGTFSYRSFPKNTFPGNLNELENLDVINPNVYKYISDKYALIYENIQSSYSDFNNAVVRVAKMNNVEAKLDLMKDLRSSSNGFRQNKFISQIYTATKTINNHVNIRSGKELNTWLYDEELKVAKNWALLCSETGIVINPSNIEA